MLIVFREVLEAGLLLGIVLGVIRGVPGRIGPEPVGGGRHRRGHRGRLGGGGTEAFSTLPSLALPTASP